ncbi:unnamed protein product [Bursaphelenchus okinawaensis]|uniref:Uncharacterized protein n=1 Tax=Bursaphelenchus okinawaensis TaxID=465554 RepID=A0A811LR16_9BILA|nr:unnamed protein product [Bursaphelenchus okinawaensis]CAG9127499.1 unnamed protein product [Bursaphelenchus okinawaensis]
MDPCEPSTSQKTYATLTTVEPTFVHIEPIDVAAQSIEHTEGNGFENEELENVFDNVNDIAQMGELETMQLQGKPEEDERYHTAYLKRIETIRDVIEEKPISEAKDWNTADLGALYFRLRHSNWNEYSVQNCLSVFDNTKAEEIAAIIDSLKEVVLEAEELRIPWKSVIGKEDLLNERTKDMKGNEEKALSRIRDLTKMMSIKKKTPFMMSEVLANAISELKSEKKAQKRNAKGDDANAVRLSEDILSPACEHTGKVKYEAIYDWLENLSLIKSTNKLRATESAVVLKIMDEMQEMVDNSFNDHADFLTQFFSDLTDQSATDLSWVEMPESDQLAQQYWNFLNLPEDFFDLSQYINQEGHGAKVKDEGNDEDVDVVNMEVAEDVIVE